MNIEKRRRTVVVGRDKLQRVSMKPLLEKTQELVPEYIPEEECKLYELTFKKKRDVDKIPICVSLFVELLKQYLVFKYVIDFVYGTLLSTL